MGILKNLNRKQRRKFDKLKTEEKQAILTHDINEKFRERLNHDVAIAFADGFLYAHKMLSDKYFECWSKAKYNDKHKIAKEMMEEIQENVKRYNDRHNPPKEDNNSKEEGEQ